MNTLKSLKMPSARAQRILDRLLKGPATTEELAALIARDPKNNKSYRPQVGLYKRQIRAVIEPLGWTIPRLSVGNPHYSRVNELTKLDN